MSTLKVNNIQNTSSQDIRGKVIQVVNFSSPINNSTTSTTFGDSSLTINITSKIANSSFFGVITAMNQIGGTGGISWRMKRVISGANTFFWESAAGHNIHTYSTSNNIHCQTTINWLDSPSTGANTTITYTLQYRSYDGSSINLGNGGNQYAGITVFEVAG